MWSKLFGGGDRLPREKVDAVVHVIDRCLAKEAELRRLQSERQTIHPRDLPHDKRQALIEEVFAILAESRKDSRHHDRKECSTGVLPSLHLDLPDQEAAEEFAGACTRKVLIRVEKVCGPCKRWRRERSHY